MPDPQHLKYLMQIIDKPSGRKQWAQFLERARNIDLTSIDLTEKELRDYNFKGVNLATAIMLDADLSGGDFSGVNLSNADLRRTRLSNAVLNEANLSGANMERADLVDASITHANLKGCRMQGANLVGANLAGADLTGADLRNAVLKFVSLAGAKLEGCDVANADLTGVVLDDEAPAKLVNVDLAKIDDRKYRMMRSRLQGSALVPTTEPKEKAKPETTVSEAVGKRRGWVNLKTGETEKENRRGKHENSVPIWETEPDLTTVEGCCRVLGIEPGAATPEVVKAFRAKAKLYHPDKVRQFDEKIRKLAAEEFRRVREAYENLTRSKARPLVNIRWAEGVPHYDSPYEYSSSHFEALVKVNPNNTNLLYNLAWKYFEEGRLEDARDGFERVLASNPEDDDARYNLMVTQLLIGLSPAGKTNF